MTEGELFRKSFEAKVEVILNSICEIARGNYDVPTSTSDFADDGLDAVLLGLAMLGEEIKATMVAKEILARERDELAKVEEALLNSISIFKSVTVAAKDGIVMIDNDGNTTFWNKAAEEILGYSSDDMIGKNLHSIVSPKELFGNYVEAFDRFKHTGEGKVIGKTVELSAVGKAGFEIPIELSLSSLFLNGKWCAVGIMRDIRERKEAEKRQKDLTVKSFQASKLAALGEMSSGIAHEINNPIAIISSASMRLEKILLNEESDPEVSKTIRLIQTTATRILKIINSIRCMARDGSGDPFVMASLKDIIDETMILCKGRLLSHNIEMVVEEMPDVRVECRPSEISQIILNLINNACDILEKEKVREIRLGYVNTGDFVEISVTDTGAGIPKEIRGRLFAPFLTTKQVGKGLGIGLNISRSLAQGHRGDLFLDESSSQTRFVLRLPKRQTDVPIRDHATSEEAACHGSFIKGSKILIIEDEDYFRDLLRIEFEDLGGVVFEALSAPAAFETIKSRGIDIVIADVHVPKGNVLELLRRIRKEIGDSPVVIAMSGYLRPEESEAIGTLADGFFDKVSGIDKLIEAIEKVFHRKTRCL
ncbi:MAG: PAS domain S-box protein [Oligoflexales bacterium]|nr:PAS domain S-box protein [Oligoflexales bacterium]